MSDKDKIRAEVYRRFIEAGKHDGVIAETREDELSSLLDFIDSLPEEPVSEDLKKFAEEWDESLYRSDAVIAGAKWHKQQMMKDAIEGYVDMLEFPDKTWIELSAIPMDLKDGDKVKLIIIKEK